jgi:hypothetical protein
MHYTLPQIEIPDELERALRERAAAEHKSLASTIVELLSRSLGIQRAAPSEPTKIRDLSDIAGSGGIDDEMEAVFDEQRRIDLSGIAGTWVNDPETEAILEEQGTLKRRDLTGIAGLRLINEEMKAVFDEQRRIDPELWK